MYISNQLVGKKSPTLLVAPESPLSKQGLVEEVLRPEQRLARGTIGALDGAGVDGVKLKLQLDPPLRIALKKRGGRGGGPR